MAVHLTNSHTAAPIARAARDFLRREGRKQPEALPEDLAVEAPSPAVSRQIASWLRALIADLGGPDREALELTDLQGVPQSELAQRLGISATGARSRVQRARRRLRELLLRCCHVELDRRGNPVAWTPRGAGCPSCKDG